MSIKLVALSTIPLALLSTPLFADSNRGVAAQMPVDCGELLVTHFSGLDGFGNVDPNGAVLTLIDTNIPPTPPTAWPVAGTLWNPQMFSNLGMGVDEWNAINLGTIFGLAMTDTVGNPDVYVAASPGVYGNFGLLAPGILGPAGEGGIYKIDGTTGQISIFIPTGFTGVTQMPNKGPGLGNIHVTPSGSHVYATNLDDGKIYVIDATGTIVQIYDPFGANQLNDGAFATLGERPYAIAIQGTKLYFSNWLRDGGRISTAWPASNGPAPTVINNSIWSVDVLPGGMLSGAPQLEIVLPYLPNNSFSNPVTDISFSPTGTMMVAERTYTSDYGQIDAGHVARVLEYEPGWSASTRIWHLGMPIVGGVASNSVGGVASDDNSHTWSTCDQIGAGGMYGLTRLPFPGNTLPTRITSSIPIQLNGVLKNAMGELDYRTCNTPDVVGACCVRNLNGDFLCVIVTQQECFTVYQQSTYYGDGTTCVSVVCDDPSAMGACCYEEPGIGWQCFETSIQECQILGGTWFSGQQCVDIVCQGTDPVGACCYMDLTGTIICIETTQIICEIDLAGNWLPNTPCTAVNCTDPHGACCYADAAGNILCSQMIETDCVNLTGMWFANQTCADVNCDGNPLGACCYIDSTGVTICSVTTQIICEIDLSGTWFANTPCTQVNCGDPLGACCFEDVAGWQCLDTGAVECDIIYGGVWYGGQPCSAIDCTPADPIGACCFSPPGAIWMCVETTQIDCEDNLLGMWFIGQTCADIDCFALDPIGACCYQDPVGWQCIISSQLNCSSLGGTWYPGQSCATIVCPPVDPLGACCYEDPAVGWVCMQSTELDCVNHSGTWYNGLACADIICQDPTGACCYVDATGYMVCTETTAAECDAFTASFYNGDGTICTDVICCLPVGACCVIDRCVLTSEPLCILANGVYAGDGVACAQINCAVCVGDLNLDGVVDIADLLVLISAWGLCP